MAVNAPYFLDAADLSSATAVYLDSDLTYIAPDGFYRDGTVVRQQSTGILLSVETCEACADCIRYIATTEEFTGGADYTDCSGLPQTVTLGTNQSENFCAEEGSVTPIGETLISLSATSCP